jgi:UDP-2-acetamido-3-amino-2,3-dideoxy-glucuronate N-acetyltransferase
VSKLSTPNKLDIAPRPDLGQNVWVHPSSVIDLPCSIGEGTKIWHFCHISAGATLGAFCSLGQNVYVAPSVRIGKGVKIQNNVSLYDGVLLEDEVFCGPSLVFTNIKIPRSSISRKSEYLTTLVRQGATLGANATILCGIEIGKYAFLGAGSVLTTSVPDYALMQGNPARLAGWRCECGEALSFKRQKSICASCHKPYCFEQKKVHRLY